MKSILEFQDFYSQNRKISMLTCYDYTSARILSNSNVDAILVGDSLAMTMHGHSTTLPATPELMAVHTAAVKRGAGDKLLVADLPFLAHRGSLDRTLDAVRLVMAAGAHAVKIEGVDGSEGTIRHIVESGVPVMGHLGLTPQSLHQLGGFKVQGSSDETASVILNQALRLEKCGVFAIVLECVPSVVAEIITRELRIPTIGIGAGIACSGQILVWQDVLGLNADFKPKFVRRYLDGAEIFRRALDAFDQDVKSARFPSIEESYLLKREKPHEALS